MLRSFRQVFKSNRTPMAAVMIVVLLGLVAYLAPTGGAVSRDTVVARVYGHEVTMQELPNGPTSWSRMRKSEPACGPSSASTPCCWIPKAA